MNFFKRKDFDSVKEVGSASGLQKNLNGFDLILLGLGGIIGTGVFVLTGLVAARYSGPAIMASYAIAGITCIFVAMVYTEMATMLPTAGSVYTYAYVGFGELAAWLVAAIIVLELNVGGATVAAGWSSYIQAILTSGGVNLPEALTKVPADGGIVNLPAVILVAFVCLVLCLGTKESKRLNAILVAIKMAAITAFIIAAVPHLDTAKWDDFMPFGTNQVFKGASILFFAFTGFGTLSTAAEECKNPTRDLTIGIIGSLVLSTTVYIVVAGLATGIVYYHQLDTLRPLADALQLNGNKFGSVIVAVGAVCGMTTVLMMQIYGLSRIAYVVARDGLLPKSLAKIHPKYDSPYVAIIVFSFFAALMTGFLRPEILAQLASMGALVDYLTIASVVMLFRLTKSDIERPFKCPLWFIVVPMAFMACVFLLGQQVFSPEWELLLPGKLLFSWLGLMTVVYAIFRGFKK